ncbi:MAG: hypothetical protein IIB00_08270 [candidate division Zixibacteria bacterium]|nr:hypothetical protein [candidate division Zixibacteria bacterium]
MISERNKFKLARMILALFALFIFTAACGSDQAKETADLGAGADDQIASEQTEEAATETSSETANERAKDTTPKTSNETKASTKQTNVATTETSNETETPTTPSEPQTVELEVPSGMNIAITLVDEIESGQNQTGDKFRATLDEDIVIGGRTVFAAGSEVEGLIEKAVGSGRLKTDAELKITLKYLDGQEIFTNSIEDKGSSHKKRNKELIGGGAIAGGILGALKGKDIKGAIIGAAAGAAIGAGAATLTGKQNLRYEPGTKLSFALTEPIIVEMTAEK